MLSDQLKTINNINIGDVVYIYEYKDRKNIESIEDLTKITVETIFPKNKNSKDVLVKGRFENLGEDDKIIEDSITGVIAYTTNGRLINTSEGLKYGSYYIDKKAKMPVPCLRKIKEQRQFFDLYIVFALSENIQIRTLIKEDIIFPSLEDAEQYTDYLSIKHGELHNGYIKFFANDVLTVFTKFDVIINNQKYASKEKLQEIFNYCCRNKNPINQTRYDFNKIFSLKHTSFELDEIIIDI